MKLVLIVEGATEKAFIPYLRTFLKNRLAGQMPHLRIVSCGSCVPTGVTLKRHVERLLGDRKKPVDHVIVLTDIYTGTNPPVFKDAADAKYKMKQWVGDNPRFHPHAAQYDFEAWLLPYWPTIQRLAAYKGKAPTGEPEKVNHNNPPASRIKKVFTNGSHRKSYVKARDAGRILRENDLSIAIDQCPELKALVNTILSVCDAPMIP